jgi:hypothetical protein
MKPQDLVILLKIIILQNKDWKVVELASALYLSQSEVSKALERLVFSGLLDESKRVPSKNSIYNYIVNAVKFSFPIRPGRMVKGIPTSHSAPPLKSKIVSDDKYVWPHINGTTKGESIEPLYEKAPDAALEDIKLYEMLALIDSLRVGKVREQEIAKEELKKRILE